MNFKDYYLKAQKVHKFRLKTIVCLDDAAMDSVERILRKYNPTSVSRPKKTIMQKNPLDFIGVEYAEVYIVDFETHMPVSPWMLRRELEVGLGVPEKYIVIRSKDDPLEDEATKAAGEEPEKETDTDVPLAGNDRVNKLLQYVEELEKKRKDEIAAETKKKIDFSLLNTLDKKETK
jgi:hypothetical protein